MDEHPLAKAPFSSKPHVRISYYDYQVWFQTLDSNNLTRWEMLRMKMMHEKYFFGRTLLQLPMIGISYGLAHFLVGPPIRRLDGGFREMFMFGTMIYVIMHHWVDKRKVPCRYMDELFTQQSPNGDDLRALTKEYTPELWEDIKAQMSKKGVYVPEPEVE